MNTQKKTPTENGFHWVKIRTENGFIENHAVDTFLTMNGGWMFQHPWGEGILPVTDECVTEWGPKIPLPEGW